MLQMTCRIDSSSLAHSNCRHPVYSAEAFAIKEALKYFSDSFIYSPQVIIISDSHSVLSKLKGMNPTKKLGFIEKEIINSSNILKMAGVTTTYLWIRGHQDIHGNSVADHLASQSTRLPRRMLCEFPCSDLNRWVKQQQMTGWEKFHLNYHAGSRYKRLFPQPRSIPWFRKMPARPKTFYRILSRLRTGHCVSKLYLHRIGRAESPSCHHCSEEGDAEHSIMVCPAHRGPRLLLFNQIDEVLPRPYNLDLVIACECVELLDALVKFILDNNITI